MVEILFPAAFARRELAAAVAAETVVAVFGAVELRQEITRLAVDEPNRTLALKDSWRLKEN
jgi:hypothetical protein